MTRITVYKDRSGAYLGFECAGHAGYAVKGEDIVCAGISALVINTVNALEEYTAEDFTVDSDENSGRIVLRFQKVPGHDGGLLMRSLVLGLQGIQHTYGSDYVILNFKEV